MASNHNGSHYSQNHNASQFPTIHNMTGTIHDNMHYDEHTHGDYNQSYIGHHGSHIPLNHSYIMDINDPNGFQNGPNGQHQSPPNDDNESIYSYYTYAPSYDGSFDNASWVNDDFETASYIQNHIEDDTKKKEHILRQKKLVIVAILKALSRYGCTTHRIEYLVHKVRCICLCLYPYCMCSFFTFFCISFLSFLSFLSGCKWTRCKMSRYGLTKYVYDHVW